MNDIKGYLESGGKPAASVKEQLNLDEDFIYDPNEAMTDPDSDSAKVFNAHVDSMVQGRVNNIMQGEKQKAAQVRQAIDRRKEEAAFKEKYNMGDEDFAELIKIKEKEFTHFEMVRPNRHISDDGSVIAATNRSRDNTEKSEVLLYKFNGQDWIEFSEKILSESTGKTSSGGTSAVQQSIDLSEDVSHLVIGES